MMNGRRLFDLWAPEGAVWSPWAKPVLFTAVDQVGEAPPSPILPPAENTDWVTGLGRHAALVIDLPGSASVHLGLATTFRGYRPVPLFNAAYGPNPVIPLADTLRALKLGGALLPQVNLAPDAPPAFLLDAHRQIATGPASPGQFDNRWVVFPQDFPSASMLKARDIHAVVLAQRSRLMPEDDLAHVLLRWQEAGIVIYARSDTDPVPAPIRVKRPPRYRAFFHRLFATWGLLRNSAGGFGTVIPDPQATGSGIG